MRKFGQFVSPLIPLPWSLYFLPLFKKHHFLPSPPPLHPPPLLSFYFCLGLFFDLNCRPCASQLASPTTPLECEFWKYFQSFFFLLFYFKASHTNWFFFHSAPQVYTTGHQSVYRLLFRVAGEVLFPFRPCFLCHVIPSFRVYTSQYSGALVNTVALEQEGCRFVS